jgi:hypothetical protein
MGPDIYQLSLLIVLIVLSVARVFAEELTKDELKALSGRVVLSFVSLVTLV